MVRCVSRAESREARADANPWRDAARPEPRPLAKRRNEYVCTHAHTHTHTHTHMHKAGKLVATKVIKNDTLQLVGESQA